MVNLNALIALGIVLMPAVCTANGSYFPIEHGWEWRYEGPSSAYQNVEIRGTTQVIGKSVAVREVVTNFGTVTEVFARRPTIDRYENYWSEDGGATFLHGSTSFYSFGGHSQSYDPPILWIDPPLFVGKTWSTTTQAYSDLSGSTPVGDPYTFEFMVTAEGEVDVPAGTFLTYTIQEVWRSLGAPATSGIDLLGRQVGGATSRSGPMWFEVAAGVGEPAHVFENSPWQGVLNLVSYGGPVSVPQTTGPVSVRRTTWGRLKEHYR